MNESNHLWKDILKFSQDKYKLAAGLIIVGTLGLLLPVMPGILLILAGLVLLKPEWYERAKKWIRKSGVE